MQGNKKVHKLMPTFAIYWIQSKKYKVILLYFFHKTMVLFLFYSNNIIVLMKTDACKINLQARSYSILINKIHRFLACEHFGNCLILFFEQYDSRISPFFLKYDVTKQNDPILLLFLVWLDRDKCTFCVHKRIIFFFLIEMRSTMILKPWT